MDYKIITVPITDDAAAPTALSAAFRLARQHNAHVSAIHIRVGPVEPDYGQPRRSREEPAEEPEWDGENRGAPLVVMLHGLFSDHCDEFGVPIAKTPSKRNDCSAYWSMLRGSPRHVISIAGRLSDLIVLGQPPHRIDPESGRFIRASLFETSTPVLLMPPGWAAPIGTRVVIAWDKGVEAMRAVKAAMPFLQRADDVFILSAGESDKVGPGVQELRRYLKWHDVAATAKVVRGGGSAPEKKLLKEITGLQPDLIVMGAYSRNQISRLVFGSFTALMLNQRKFPLLLRA